MACIFIELLKPFCHNKAMLHEVGMPDYRWPNNSGAICAKKNPTALGSGFLGKLLISRQLTAHAPSHFLRASCVC